MKFSRIPVRAGYLVLMFECWLNYFIEEDVDFDYIWNKVEQTSFYPEISEYLCEVYSHYKQVIPN